MFKSRSTDILCCCCLCLALTLSSRESYAQTYPTKLYTTADGLPQSSISCLMQDSQGNIWFGSGGGVAKYDAKRFWSYKNNAMHVQSLCEDSAGTIWIGTYGLGIARTARGDTSFTWLNKASGRLPSDNVFCILRDARNTMWIGTDEGLVVLSSGRNPIRATSRNGLPSDQVNALAMSKDGTVWIGTHRGFLGCRLDDSLEFVTGAFAPYAAIISLTVLRNGDVLAGTHTHACGILRWREGRMDTLVYTSIPLKVMGILQDTRDMLWVGTGAGLKQVNEGRLQSIALINLPSSYIDALLEDHEGSIWCASENGVAELPTLFFKNYTMSTGMPGPQVISLYEGADRTIYVGTYKGVRILPGSGDARTLDVSNGLPHNSVFAFCEAVRGEIWIGTNNGVRILKNGKLTKTGIVDLDDKPVYQILRTPEGKLWCSSQGKVLSIAARKVETILGQSEGIPDVPITVLHVDKSGRLWLGTGDHGVGLRDGNNKIAWWTTRDGLPSDWIHSIAEDGEGRLWVGTHEGAASWTGHRFEPLNQPALKNATVSCIVPGDSGHVWFGTQNGLFEWKDSVLQHFMYEDGLAADGVRCGMFRSDGDMLIGTVGGLSQLDHAAYRRMLPHPTITIEAVSVDGRSGGFTSSGQLRYDENTLTIGFNSISFKNERLMSFQWKLAGFDADWQTPLSQREVRYTHLPSGSYTFSVRARNRNGPWSDPATYAFVITPPFWEMWWFRISIALAVIGTGTLVYRRRVRLLESEKRNQQEFSNRLISSQENERKRIAGELHDSIGQNLLVIRNRALMGLKDSGLSTQARDQLDQISSVATQAIDEVRGISYGLRPYQLDRLGLTKAIMSITTGLATSVRFSMSVDPIDDEVGKEQAIHVYRIVQEGINNILKHSGASEAHVEVRVEGSNLRIVISDHGKGMSGEHAGNSNTSRGFGLAGINERAKILNGTMTIESMPGQGTTLTVVIPRTGRAH